jgi:hypothetical protein
MARDLQDDQRWKYDELSPVQLLEKLSLHEYLVNSDELERAEYFWSHRPRFRMAITYMLLGLFWLSGCHFGYSLSWQ